MNSKEIVLSSDYIFFLKDLDPDGTNDTDADDQILDMKQYCKIGSKNYDNVVHLDYEIAIKTTFFWMNSGGDVFGLFREFGKDHIVCLNYQGGFRVFGDSVSNWIEKEYTYLTQDKIIEFMRRCHEIFEVPITSWDGKYPDFTKLELK